MKVFIVNPDNNELRYVESWKKEENPTRAKFIVLELDNGEKRMYYKNKLRMRGGKTNMTWKQALKMAEEFKEDGLVGWKLESRREALDCAGDAWDIFPGAVALIGGDIVRDCFWTSEAFQSKSTYAWFFRGTYGYLDYTYHRSYANAVRVFRAY